MNSRLKKGVKKLEKKAKEIEKDSEKARKELSKDARSERKDATHNIIDTKKSKASARKVKENIEFDIKVHRLEKGDVKDAMHEVDEIDCAAKDADYIIREADRLQKRRKK
jgi:hypothetical protein